MQDFHHDKISGPVYEAVLSNKAETDIKAIRQAFNCAMNKAMKSESPQIAGLKYQLQTLMDAAQFLSAMRVPKLSENRTKEFITGILRIVKTNGGKLKYNKNKHTGTLADVYEFFRAMAPVETWKDLSPPTLQRLKEEFLVPKPQNDFAVMTTHLF